MDILILPDMEQRVSRVIAPRPIVDVADLRDAGFSCTIERSHHGYIGGVVSHPVHFFVYSHHTERNEGEEVPTTSVPSLTECHFVIDEPRELHIKLNGQWYVLDYAGLLAYAGGRA